MTTDCVLTPSAYVLASSTSEPTALLREAANIRFCDKVIAFLLFCTRNNTLIEFQEAIEEFLSLENTPIYDLASSPVFRSWFQRVSRLSNWNDIDEYKRELLHEFVAIAIDPEAPQACFAEFDVHLYCGRYSSPGLDWGWRAEDQKRKAISIGQLKTLLEQSRTMRVGEKAHTSGVGLCGSIVKFHKIANATFLTNFPPQLKVRLTGTNQRTTGVEFESVAWDEYAEQFDVDKFTSPFALLQEVWPEEFADFCEVVRTVVPMNTTGKARAFTVSSHQGSIFVTPHSPRQMLEMLVHEKAHVKQRYIEEIWPLLKPEQTKERFNVPWRSDARPIFGIFEGIYVFLQVATVLLKCHQCGYADVKSRATGILRDLDHALDIVGRHAQMTPLGREFYQAIVEACRSAASNVDV